MAVKQYDIAQVLKQLLPKLNYESENEYKLKINILEPRITTKVIDENKNTGITEEKLLDIILIENINFNIDAYINKYTHSNLNPNDYNILKLKIKKNVQEQVDYLQTNGLHLVFNQVALIALIKQNILEKFPSIYMNNTLKQGNEYSNEVIKNLQELKNELNLLLINVPGTENQIKFQKIYKQISDELQEVNDSLNNNQQIEVSKNTIKTLFKYTIELSKEKIVREYKDLPQDQQAIVISLGSDCGKYAFMPNNTFEMNTNFTVFPDTPLENEVHEYELPKPKPTDT
ncbi:hypothetical protein N9L02_01180 [Gammaproteobacteria bacterium]|nr:hypothetical protein [Gammaproteobacteria bacterium]